MKDVEHPASSLSFTCSILMYLRKTLHESCKIFVEHVLHVARIQFEPRPNSLELGAACSVMIIGLSMKGCLHLKTQFEID